MTHPWPHSGCRVRFDAGDLGALVRTLLPDATQIEHVFEPVGLSVVRLGPGGMLAVHTWPERGVATVDGYGAVSVDLPARLHALGWVVLE